MPMYLISVCMFWGFLTFFRFGYGVGGSESNMGLSCWENSCVFIIVWWSKGDFVVRVFCSRSASIVMLSLPGQELKCLYILDLSNSRFFSFCMCCLVLSGKYLVVPVYNLLQ